MSEGNLHQCNCTVCGKLMFPTPGWQYKINYKGTHYICCSYKCYRQIQIQKEGQRSYTKIGEDR